MAPSASLRLGPAGRGPCAAASHTFLPTSEALLCPSLTCLRTSGGTPQVALFSCKLLIILVSADRKALNSLHNSSGGAFFWPAVWSAWPCLPTSSRVAKSCWQPGGGWGGENALPGIPPPGAGDIPGEPGMPGIPPNCAAAGHTCGLDGDSGSPDCITTTDVEKCAAVGTDCAAEAVAVCDGFQVSRFNCSARSAAVRDGEQARARIRGAHRGQPVEVA